MHLLLYLENKLSTIWISKYVLYPCKWLGHLPQESFCNLNSFFNRKIVHRFCKILLNPFRKLAILISSRKSLKVNQRLVIPYREIIANRPTNCNLITLKYLSFNRYNRSYNRFNMFFYTITLKCTSYKTTSIKKNYTIFFYKPQE